MSKISSNVPVDTPKIVGSSKNDLAANISIVTHSTSVVTTRGLLRGNPVSEKEPETRKNRCQ
jgi:hypothetical protein